MVHLAIFNLEKHEVECEQQHAEDAVVEDVIEKDEVVDGKKTGNRVREVAGTFPAPEFHAWRLSVECTGRGSLEGAWQVYKGTVPFSWDIVAPPKEAQSA